MSELDDLEAFTKQMEEYNRVQLRQTLDFIRELSESLGAINNPLQKFEENWVGLNGERNER